VDARRQQAKARELGSSDAMASAILNANFANRFWLGGFGMWEEADARDGYQGYEFDSYGFIGGYDRVFGPLTLGGAFAYNTGDYEDKAAIGHDSDIDSYSFSLYGTYNHASGFFASAFGGYSLAKNDINELRTAADGWQKAKYDTDSWNLGFEIGYDIKPTPCFTLTPSVGFGYIHSRNEDHDSILNDLVLGRLSGSSVKSAYLPVKLDAAYDIPLANGGKFNLNANVGYAYNFTNDGIDGTFTLAGINGDPAIRVTGIEPGRHAWNVGAGVRYSAGRFDIGVNYDYSAKKDYDAHRVLGTVGISF
jgi:outer membrane autotransporter protein